MLNNLNANIQACIDHSVDVAIFLNYMAQWSYHNLANNKNIHDGLVWTYNSIEAFKKYFPYWTSKQILYVIKKAMDAGLVQKGNYNKSGYDRTSWYALTAKGRAYYPELNEPPSSEDRSTTHLTKLANGFDKIGKPIPTNKPTNKKDINIKTLISKKASKPVDPEQLAIATENNPHEIPEQMIEDWIRKRKAKKNPLTKTCVTRVNNALTKIRDLLKISPTEAFAKMVAKGWLSLELEYFQPTKPQGRSNEKDNFANSTWK